MRSKIANTVCISVSGVDLTKISHIEFYVRQKDFFEQYTPEVISAEQMLVRIPYGDAMKLKYGSAEVQFAYVDESGLPQASPTMSVSVGSLLKEDGYDPVSH